MNLIDMQINETMRARRTTVENRRVILEQNPVSNATCTMLWDLHDAFVDHCNNDSVTRDVALILIATFAAKLPVTVRLIHDDAVEFMSLAICEGLKSYVWVSTYLPHDKTEPCACCIADECYTGNERCELIAVLEHADS
jgi:hypothetical protein